MKSLRISARLIGSTASQQFDPQPPPSHRFAASALARHLLPSPAPVRHSYRRNTATVVSQDRVARDRHPESRGTSMARINLSSGFLLFSPPPAHYQRHPLFNSLNLCQLRFHPLRSFATDFVRQASFQCGKNVGAVSSNVTSEPTRFHRPPSSGQSRQRRSHRDAAARG